MLNLLHPSEVLTLHQHLAQHASITTPTVRDSLLIELACVRAHLAQHQQPKSQQLFNTTAILTESLILWRPFTMLNNATAFAVLQATLALNNHKLACSSRIARQAAESWNETTQWPTIANWLSLAAEKSST